MAIFFSTIKKSSNLTLLDGIVDIPVDSVIMEGCLSLGRIPIDDGFENAYFEEDGEKEMYFKNRSKKAKPS